MSTNSRKCVGVERERVRKTVRKRERDIGGRERKKDREERKKTDRGRETHTEKETDIERREVKQNERDHPHTLWNTNPN